MAKYLVQLQRRVIETETVFVTVDARSEQGARQKARAQAYDADEWYHAKSEGSEACRSHIVKIEEVPNA